MLFILFSAVLAFGAACSKAGRSRAVALRWKPDRHAWAALAVGGGAAFTSATLRLLPATSALRRVLHYGVLYAGFGFALPAFFALLWADASDLETLGISRRKTRRAWTTNAAVALFFGALLVSRWVRAPPSSIADLFAASLVLFVGITAECLLFCGFVHRRLDAAFGFVPAILVTSVLYSLWHVGTQLPLETATATAAPAATLAKLFLVGVMYQSMFSAVDCVVFGVWPFSLLAGALIDFTVNPAMLAIVARRWTLASSSLALGSTLFSLVVWLAKRDNHAA